VRSRAQRLGRNISGYAGDGIEVETVLKDCLAAAQAHGWSVGEVPAGLRPRLLTLTRLSSAGSLVPSAADTSPATDPLRGGAKPRIYISTGIHGDEPAGPLAARQLLEENDWPPATSLWLCPCLNPTGFALNRRENDEGIDLNRQYLLPTAEETKTHIGWLKQQPAFDLCLCLHEDWESHGFYLYELNPDGQPSLAEPIIERVREVCPIDHSEMIEGRAARNGIVRPSVDPRSRPQWPESFFLLTYKTRLSYTLEAPSDFPLPVRVAALVTAVQTGVRLMKP
jgi:succinylglutamate desuccinylase/aspartoacylase family protein